MTDYLDCNATTPVDPRVQAEILHYLDVEFGNPASPHDYGARAKAAVQLARDRIAAVAGARRHEVFFTSGATESNNLALLGLSDYGEKHNQRHLLSTQIEHASVLEPLAELQRRGFQLTLIPPDAGGRIAPQAVVDALRPDTLIVSVMHVNNETGVVQPVAEIADLLAGREVFSTSTRPRGSARTSRPCGIRGSTSSASAVIRFTGPKGSGPCWHGGAIPNCRRCGRCTSAAGRNSGCDRAPCRCP